MCLLTKIRPWQIVLLLIQLILVALLLPAKSFGQNPLTITGITNASGYVIDNNATSEIYGGLSGALIGGCTSLVDSSTCNNCDISSETACNPKRIHGILDLKISFTVNADISGTVFVGYNAGTDTQITTHTAATGLSNGSSSSVTIDWSNLCVLDGDISGTCNQLAVGTGPRSYPIQFNMFVGVGSNTTEAFQSANRSNITLKFFDPESSVAATPDNDLITCADGSTKFGLCNFKAHPGDKKVYVDDLEAVGTCTGDIKYARVYYNSVDLDEWTTAQYGSGNYKDLEFASDCEASGDWVIEGLENDTTYYFRSAIIDTAGNIAFLIDDSVSGIKANAACSTPAVTNDVNCDLIATPSEVAGLLAEELNCFVASASFGSRLHKNIKTFRAFRDKILKSYSLGRSFIKWYYVEGPAMAKVIKKHEWLRTISRTVLWPLWGFSWMAIHYGLGGALIALLSLLIFCVYWLKQNNLKQQLVPIKKNRQINKQEPQ